MASRQAVLCVDPGGAVSVTDLCSPRPTRAGGQVVDGPTSLPPGQPLTMGSSTLEVEAVDVDAALAEAADAGRPPRRGPWPGRPRVGRLDRRTPPAAARTGPATRPRGAVARPRAAAAGPAVTGRRRDRRDPHRRRRRLAAAAPTDVPHPQLDRRAGNAGHRALAAAASTGAAAGRRRAGARRDRGRRRRSRVPPGGRRGAPAGRGAGAPGRRGVCPARRVATLWARRADEPGAFAAVVGRGDRWQPPALATGGDAVPDEWWALVEAAGALHDVPVAVDLGPGAVVGVVGSPRGRPTAGAEPGPPAGRRPRPRRPPGGRRDGARTRRSGAGCAGCPTPAIPTPVTGSMATGARPSRVARRPGSAGWTAPGRTWCSSWTIRR